MRKSLLYKTISLILISSLLFQNSALTEVSFYPSSTSATLPLLRYLSLNSHNPFNYFNFLLDPKEIEDTEYLTKEAKKLINYFFLGITLPDESFWVNLQPNQSDRITSSELSKTDLGKILLEQDLLLKKDMANLLHPKNSYGKLFWNKLYSEADKLLGKGKLRRTAINTQNRVWITPEKATVLETEDGVLITEANLKVLLESEYLNLKSKSLKPNYQNQEDLLQELSEDLMKEIIIPEITKKVNEDPKYSPLRQIYYSLILAQWFKRKSARCKVLGAGYGEQNKTIHQSPPTQHQVSPYELSIDKGWTDGLESEVPWKKDLLFQEYLKSYTEGEYKLTETISGLKRMYFSGGIVIDEMFTGSSPVVEIINSLHGLLKKSDINLIPLITKNNPDDIKEKGSSPLFKKIVAVGVMLAITGSLAFFQTKESGYYPIQEIEELISKEDPAVSPKIIEDLKQQHNIPALTKLASEGNERAVETLRDLAYHGNISAKDALKNLNPKVFITEAEGGDGEAVWALRDLTDYGNISALNGLISLAKEGNREAVRALRDLADYGNISALNGLISLVKEGNREAVRALRDLAYHGNISAKDALKNLNPKVFITEAEGGDGEAVRVLRDLAYHGNISAKDALKNLNPKVFITEAEGGDGEAVWALRDLADYGNISAKNTLKNLNPKVFITEAEGGDGEAVWALRDLADYGNISAKNTLKNLNPKVFITEAEGGDGEAVWALRDLTDYGNISALNGLISLAKEGNETAYRELKYITNSMVLDLRRLHLEERISDIELEKRLTEKSFNNHPFILYASYTSQENIGILGRMMLERLRSQAQRQNKDLHSFLKELDPKEIFYRDFILQSAHFNHLPYLLSDLKSLDKIMDYLFRELSPETVKSYSLRLALFTEDVLGDKGFIYQKEFQRYLRELYDKTSGLNQRLIAALLTVYRDKLNYLNPNDISNIAKSQGIKEEASSISYDELFKDSKLVVHIVFADKDAVEGHYLATKQFFQEKGGYKVVFSIENQTLLEKNNIHIVLIKADKEGYDINTHLKEVDIIISRGHAGSEQEVFKPQLPPLESKGKIFFLSACRSATTIGKIASNYPDAFFIGVNSTAFGIRTNGVTHLLLKALSEKISSWEEIRDSIKDRLPETSKDYILPGDPPWRVYNLISSTSSSLTRIDNFASSPVEKTGGIDLSEIELILQDEAFISSLNPVDLKILLAAKALEKDGWNSLSLLRIHEVIGLLKDGIVEDFQNKELLLRVLEQLKTNFFLDSQALQFFYFLQSQKPISELKLSFSH